MDWTHPPFFSIWRKFCQKRFTSHFSWLKCKTTIKTRVKYSWSWYKYVYKKIEKSPYISSVDLEIKHQRSPCGGLQQNEESNTNITCAKWHSKSEVNKSYLITWIEQRQTNDQHIGNLGHFLAQRCDGVKLVLLDPKWSMANK